MNVPQSTDAQQPTAEHVVPDRLEWQSAILADRKLSAKARLVALVLGAHFNFRRDASWTISSATLLAETGIKNPKTLAAAIGEVRSAGYVIVKRHRGASEFAAALPADGSPKNGDASAPMVHRKTVGQGHRKTVKLSTQIPFTDQRRARTRERLRLLTHDEFDAHPNPDWPLNRSTEERTA